MELAQSMGRQMYKLISYADTVSVLPVDILLPLEAYSILMARWKTAVSPVCQQCIYCSLALSLWYDIDHSYGSGFVKFCCDLVHADFTHILQGYFTGTGAIICQWSDPEGYGSMDHTTPPITLNRSITKQSTMNLLVYFLRCTVDTVSFIFHITDPLWGESMGHQWVPIKNGQWCVKAYRYSTNDIFQRKSSYITLKA